RTSPAERIGRRTAGGQRKNHPRDSPGTKGPQARRRLHERGAGLGRRPEGEDLAGGVPPGCSSHRLRRSGGEGPPPGRIYERGRSRMILTRILEHKKAELRHKQSRSYLSELKAQ